MLLTTWYHRRPIVDSFGHSGKYLLQQAGPDEGNVHPVTVGKMTRQVPIYPTNLDKAILLL